MQQSLRRALKAAVDALGYEVHRADLAHSARRVRAMECRGVTCVLDVGANRGQYGTWLRKAGYHGDIVSFEPLPEAFTVLEARAREDRRWRALPFAVGGKEGTVELNVSGSDVLSSVLRPDLALSSQIAAAGVTRTQTARLVALDDLWSELVPAGAQVLLKIDVQGYEHAVLDGVSAHLPGIALVEAEMGLQQLYQDGSTIHDVLPRLREVGLQVISIDSGFVDGRTGQVLDVDVLVGAPLPLGQTTSSA